jgi:hypothetical protein
VVIKKYIWGLFTFPGLNLINEIPSSHREFFIKNWPCIWTNDPDRSFVILSEFGSPIRPFERYSFRVDKPTTFHSILTNSIRLPVALIKEPRTVLTKAEMNKCL